MYHWYLIVHVILVSDLYQTIFYNLYQHHHHLFETYFVIVEKKQETEVSPIIHFILLFSPGFHYLVQFATVPFHADWLSNMNFAIVCNSNSTTWLFPDQILKGWHIVWTCLFWSNFEMLQHDRQPEPAVCWLLVEPGGTITKLLLLVLLWDSQTSQE